MTDALATTPTTGLTIVQSSRNPAITYLASLSQSSRRTMAHSLAVLAGTASADSIDAQSFPWGNLRFEHTQAIRSKLAERYSPASANRHLCALRGVLKDAWRLKLMSADDYRMAIDLKAITGTKADAAEKGRHLVTGEFNALLAGCLDGSIVGARDACLIIFAYTSGLRRAELAAIQLADVDRLNCTLTVKSGKGKKERVVPMATSTCDVLEDWLLRRGESEGALFTRISKGDHLTLDGLGEQAVYVILTERAKASGVKAFTPHDMRRTFAGDLLDAGNDISTVAKLMGHSSVTTTARYDRRDGRAKRRAIDTLHVSYKRQAV